MARIVLYTKPDCSVCEDARALLDAIGEPFEVSEEPAFADRVPLIEVDGVVVAERRVDERAVRRAIRRARRRRSAL